MTTNTVITGWTALFDARFPMIERRVQNGESVELGLRVNDDKENVTFTKDCLHVIRNDKKMIVGIAIDVDGDSPKRYFWFKDCPVSFPPCSPRFVCVQFTGMQIAV